MKTRCAAWRLVRAVLAAIGMSLSVAAATQAAETGTVLIRPSLEGLKYVNKFLLKARPVEGGEAVDIDGWGWSSDGYWSRYYEEGEKGDLAILTLPAGDYEIHSFAATAGAWGGTRTVSPSRDLSYRFRVNAGEAVYLGNLHVRFLGDTGVVAPAYVVVENKRLGLEIGIRDGRERDMAEATQRESALTPDRIQVRLLK